MWIDIGGMSLHKLRSLQIPVVLLLTFCHTTLSNCPASSHVVFDAYNSMTRRQPPCWKRQVNMATALVWRSIRDFSIFSVFYLIPTRTLLFTIGAALLFVVHLSGQTESGYNQQLDQQISAHQYSYISCNFFPSSLTVPAAKYCNYGSDINSQDSLKNQSCSTGEVHLLSTLLVADQDDQPTYQDATVHYFDKHLQTESMHRGNHPCFIFRHIVRQTISPDVQQESVHIDFGCDFNNFCESKEMNQVISGEIVNNLRGQLFCCDSDNCNQVVILPHLPAENRVCYNGTDNKFGAQSNHMESFSKDMKESCAHPDAMCAKMYVYLPQGVVESYFCDNDMLCRDQMSSGSFKSCYSKVVNQTTQRLCCCDTNMCFEPQWPDPDNTNKLANDSVPDFIDTETNYILVAAKDGVVVTGLIAALIFVTGVGGGIIIVIACKRRRRPRPNPNVIMQYERLSLSDSDADGAVIL